jgi:inhibitor of KinA sporulation pathway (predicted exonuclease)
VLAVLDTEITAWEGSLARRWSGPGEAMEIVEIGAVKLDAGRGMAELESFEALVRPRINPALDAYFVRLTGITQADVDARGTDFATALAAFVRFLGRDGAGGGVGAVVSTGSDGFAIEENCRLNGLAFPFARGLFHDITDDLARMLGRERRAVESSGLPELLGFPRPGPAHRALADARCVACALAVLQGRGRLSA